MTKSGEIAGPRVLEHIVDVVLYMEVGTLSPYYFIDIFFYSVNADVVVCSPYVRASRLLALLLTC